MVPRPMAPSPTGPQIPSFYAGREVLITGATGFMGKVAVARLLETCPLLERVHLLMRDKRGLAPHKRLAHLKQSPVFDGVREKCPAQLDKLAVVAGDVAQPGLGLNQEARTQLREVSVVFHAAATLKFDEPLVVAVEHNVRSVERVLEICDALPNIEALVHVSTAYSNAELSVVEEKVYPMHVSPAQVCALVDSLPEELLAKITPEYISPKPNTYTFTKALAENVIAEHGNKAYPIAIFRPTIVISSLRDPHPGWIENLNGPSGMLVGAGKGLMHVFYCKQDGRADMLPVDIAIDTMLATAWEIVTERPEEVRVYHCSTCENPTTWGAFKQAMSSHLRAHPFDDTFWYPSGYIVENEFSHKALELLLQTVPLHVAEYMARILGIKTKMSLITASHRLSAMTAVLKFFSTREWKFATGNMQRLHSRLSPQDAAIFNLDPHTINWNELYVNFTKGARKFLLQEKEQDLEKAKQHMRRMFYMHYTLLFFVLALVLRVALHNPYIRSFIYGTVRFLLSLVQSTFITVKRIE